MMRCWKWAGLGAKVLQARSVEFAKKYGVEMEVRSSFTDEEGTVVTQDDEGMEGVVVSAVNCDRKQAQITLEGIHDRPGIAGKLFGDLAEAGIVVDMIVQNVGSDDAADISFTVPLDSLPMARKIMDSTSRELGGERHQDERSDCQGVHRWYWNEESLRGRRQDVSARWPISGSTFP